MLANLLWALALLLCAAGAVWLTLRARRATHPALKWGGVAVGTLVSLILIVINVAGARGLVRLYAPRGKPPRALTVARTPERVARGEHIAGMLCAGCHTRNGQLPLSGGRNLSDEAHMPLGDLYPFNLTPAGPLAGWTDGEVFRAIREAADNKRRRLPVMSAQRARNLSDDDIAAVIAYLRSQPPVQNETPPERPSYLLAVMAGANMVPLLPPPTTDSVVAPPAGPTKEYGAYIVGWVGCDECHGANLTGGGGGVVPKGPNLRSVKNWSAEQFLTAIRTGKRPFGNPIDSTLMPWRVFARATDMELTAIHAYLVSLP